ncbi:unnamed protein product [Vicia faba]|uniref:Uncharacterized protein n=1 Tax=Vicia faba TaxID=3906 RepID=A0AAV0ZD55_VICFA|nr:unnamed protein product [Vicia faba]
MAAAILGGALLSASMEMLVGKVVDLFQRTKLDDSLLDNLKITLLSLQSVLHDAEEKQITNPAVKEWLNMLQDAVFEAEDLFDEINTEVEAEAEAGQVHKKFLSHFKMYSKKTNSKLEQLFQKLEHLKNQNLGLKEGVSSCVWNVTPTTSVLGDESSIYGRDDDKKKLKEILLLEDGCDSGSKIGVVSIVGMGGLGKTTLAKLLYNDPHVKEKFDVKGWAHIPKDLDIFTVTKITLESLSPGSIRDTNLDNLQVQLVQRLTNIKFLLVLDDIWYGNYVGWNSLIDIFNVGQKGSKIIITTRDERVVLPMQKFLYVHHLRSLKTDVSWSLLARHAFVERKYQEHPNLEKIGRKIAKKCGGLPLALIALGGILRSMSPDRWSDVLNNSIWERTNDEVQPSLLLSYRYLPTSLKGCFAYCSIFPKNSILVKKMVVQLWIAQGLIPQSKSEKTWEKVAAEYFDELVSRSLIRQRSIDDETKVLIGDQEACFEMHDLINDLAMAVSSPYCTRLDNHESDERVDKRVRHLSLDSKESSTYDKFEKLHGLKGLRTFLPMPLQASWRYDNFTPWKLVFDTLSTMTHLRVLSLSYYVNIKELPDSIGNLIYLQYLNLSGTLIRMLPSETCKLCNLQTLLLSRCEELSELPEDMGKLVKLRHLDIRGTPLKKMPVQLSSLENLQTLSDFIVTNVKEDGLKIGDLGKYPHLQERLSISQLENVIDPSHASQANLKMKNEIDELELRWSSNAPSNAQIQSVVLERLRPSTNLKSLTISGYGGDKLPNWLGSSFFSNMVCLRIAKCKNCSRLPSLGLLCNLKELFISGMQSIESVGTEFYGSGSTSFQPFTSLETLCFSNMPEWEEWKMIGGSSPEFPNLTYLSLAYCPKLKGNMPGNLPKLDRLSLNNCPELKEMTPNHHPSLADLSITNCPSLIESRDSDYTITTSPPFDVFSQLILCLNSLQKMTLLNIPSLTYFPRDGLPKTLQSLIIQDCENLEFLSHDSFHNYTSLEYLKIYRSCNRVTSFTLRSLPVLKNLTIYYCACLKSILLAEDASNQNLLSLETINIGNCNELESVSSLSGLLSPNLTDLRVTNCEKFRSLPESTNTLTSLQNMEIIGLPNLQSFSLPISLQELRVGNVGGVSWNTTWENLTSLSKLDIRGDDIVKALMRRNVPVLPTSLVSIEISGLKDIKCLYGKWLQHLTSLQKLEISHANLLKSLPEEGELPFTLKELYIIDCPLLRGKLQPRTGKEWSKISHIPYICIDYHVYQ